MILVILQLVMIMYLLRRLIVVRRELAELERNVLRLGELLREFIARPPQSALPIQFRDLDCENVLQFPPRRGGHG